MKEDNKNIEQYIVRFLTNDISDKELQILNSWKLASPKNQDEFDQFESAWLKSKQLKQFNAIDVEADWNCVCARFKVKSTQQEIKSFRLNARKIAAIFIPLLFISISGLTYWNLPGFGRLSAYETESTINELILPDGSKVILNTDSKIIYSNNIASADSRNIQLSGEAFFEVNHNNTPFIVETSNMTVEVLGTEFNVNEKSANESVSVISGKVSVMSNSSQINLTKGEKVVLTNGELIEENTQTENDIYWCSKQLQFNQATLADICKELQKNFKQIKKLKITTKDISTKVTTTFNNQSLNDIIEELEVHFTKKITFDGSTLIVSD